MSSLGPLAAIKTLRPMEWTLRPCPEEGSEAVKGVKHKSCEECLRELGLFRLEDTQGRPHHFVQLSERKLW